MVLLNDSPRFPDVECDCSSRSRRITQRLRRADDGRGSRYRGARPQVSACSGVSDTWSMSVNPWRARRSS